MYGAQLSREEAFRLWGQSISDEIMNELPERIKQNEVVRRKIKIAESTANNLNSIGVVKYIGISGSVAAGVAKEDDDIDLFIIVKDHTAWIFRLISKLTLRENTVRYGQKEQKDLICINYICEERALEFKERDIFTFNEIISLKTLAEPDVYTQILTSNNWIFKKFLLIGKPGNAKKKDAFQVTTFFYAPINALLFLTQVAYMYLMGHQPDGSRLLKGFKQGRIQFYPKDFREKKLKEFKKNKN